MLEILFWFAIALLLALVEIEVEGRFGWAEKTSTWYRTKGFLVKVWHILAGRKPLTGYHMFFNILILLFIHSGFILGLTWNLETELKLLSSYFILVTSWDFLWFILNPDYGIKNFKKDKIWWFNKSTWVFEIFPIDYLIAVVISFLVAFLNYKLTSNIYYLSYNLLFFISFLILIFVVILIAPAYHKWLKNMREKDYRKLAGIFH